MSERWGNSSGSCVPKAHQGCVKRSQRRAKTRIDKGKGATKTKRAGLAKTLLAKKKQKKQHNVGEKDKALGNSSNIEMLTKQARCQQVQKICLVKVDNIVQGGGGELSWTDILIYILLLFRWQVYRCYYMLCLCVSLGSIKHENCRAAQSGLCVWKQEWSAELSPLIKDMQTYS